MCEGLMTALGLDTGLQGETGKSDNRIIGGRENRPRLTLRGGIDRREKHLMKDKVWARGTECYIVKSGKKSKGKSQSG